MFEEDQAREIASAKIWNIYLKSNGNDVDDYGMEEEEEEEEEPEEDEKDEEERVFGEGRVAIARSSSSNTESYILCEM